MIIPWTELEAATLENLLEDYVTRDVSDQGHVDVPLAQRVASVRRLLEAGEVVIWFDPDLETVNLIHQRDLPDD